MPRLDNLLLPVSKPTFEGWVDVGDGHKLFVEESGNPAGIPFIIVQGGPGGACSAEQRQFLDPAVFRVFLFDQRGCGRSIPKGKLEDTSLQHTIRDLETLRQHFRIDRWIIGGGSWGSTVSLAYAEAHPESCLGVLVSSVWLARAEDLDWWYYGARAIFPDVWDEYASAIPPGERHDLRTAYNDRILGSDPVESRRASLAQYRYEFALMQFHPRPPPSDAEHAANYSRIYAHYSRRNFFLEENQLLRDSGALKGVPLVIVGARYDACTPFSNAYDLSRAVPGATLVIASASGHLPDTPDLIAAIFRGVDLLLAKLRRSV